MQCRPAELAPLRPRAPAQPPSSRYKAPPPGSWQFPILKTDKSKASIPLNNPNAPTPDRLPKHHPRAIDRICCCKSTLNTRTQSLRSGDVLLALRGGELTSRSGPIETLSKTALQPSVSPSIERLDFGAVSFCICNANCPVRPSYSTGREHCRSRPGTRSRPPFPRRNRRVNRMLRAAWSLKSLYNGPALIRASQSRA